MVRRLAVLAAVTAALAIAGLPEAQAIEQGLAGIKLGQPALDLLDLELYGSPQFIGPLGAVTTWGIAAPVTPAPGGVAAPAAPVAAPRAPTPRTPSTPIGRSGGLRISFGGRGGFGSSARTSPSAPTAPARPSALSFGLGARRGASAAGLAGAAQPLAAPTTTTAAAGGGPIYWLYNQGVARVIAGIDADGKVSSIVVSGRSHPAAKTEGGARLGDSYTSVLDKYGFPDSTQNAGAGLVLQYANAGLTFTLQNMRVEVIALAQAPAAGVVVPGTPGRPAAPMAPPAGYGARTLGAAAAPRTGSTATTRPTGRLRIRLGGRRGL